MKEQIVRPFYLNMKDYKKDFQSYPTVGVLLTTLYFPDVSKSKTFCISFLSFLAIVSNRKDEVHLKVGKCSVVKIYFSCVSMLLVSLVNKNIILPLLITFC